jgi:hypothetical protein
VIAGQVLDAVVQPVVRSQTLRCPGFHTRRAITPRRACGPCGGAGRARRAPGGSASAPGIRGSSYDDGCWAETFASRCTPGDWPSGRGRSRSLPDLEATAREAGTVAVRRLPARRLDSLQ